MSFHQVHTIPRQGAFMHHASQSRCSPRWRFYSDFMPKDSPSRMYGGMIGWLWLLWWEEPPDGLRSNRIIQSIIFLTLGGGESYIMPLQQQILLLQRIGDSGAMSRKWHLKAQVDRKGRERERGISFEGDALGISKLMQVLSSQHLVVGPQKRCSRKYQGDFACCWLEIPYRLKNNRRFELWGGLGFGTFPQTQNPPPP